MRIRPFREGDSYPTFQRIREEVVHEIDALENDYVLKASLTELEQHYLSRATVQPLVVDADNYYIESQEGARVDVSHDFQRASFGGHRVMVAGTRLTIAIPYTGDEWLWKVRASTYSVSGYPELEVGHDKVFFDVTFPDDSPEPERLRSEIQGTVRSIAQAVGHLTSNVDTHNAQASQEIKAALARKLEKARTAVGAVAALGIPIRHAEAPATFVLPTKRRPSPVPRPSVPAAPYEPEPTLGEEEYQHILRILKSMSVAMERSPSSLSSLDEEGIRMHFLIQLNGHYEGMATGETFNAAGKTDILIRSGDRNAFIAECKFWRGPKSFDEAISQLLSYLSWRDSKCALLVFNQTKDSTAVKAKMHEVMLARPEYRKILPPGDNADARYVFVKPSDPGREVHISTLLFDVPKA